MKSDSESKKPFDDAPHLINRRYLQCSYGQGISQLKNPMKVCHLDGDLSSITDRVGP
jgi:hypothetical protein